MLLINNISHCFDISTQNKMNCNYSNTNLNKCIYELAISNWTPCIISSSIQPIHTQHPPSTPPQPPPPSHSQ